MDVDTVWRTGSGDLPKAKATIESIKILFSPATASPSHLLQQLHITIGHASPLPCSSYVPLSGKKPQSCTQLVYLCQGRLRLRLPIRIGRVMTLSGVTPIH